MFALAKGDALADNGSKGDILCGVPVPVPVPEPVPVPSPVPVSVPSPEPPREPVPPGVPVPAPPNVDPNVVDARAMDWSLLVVVMEEVLMGVRGG